MAISSNGDKYFSNVSLLLPFDGANGSTTFYDASPVPKAITTVGNTNISTTQSKFGGSSGYFDGAGDYLTIPDDNVFTFDADFTIEAWIYVTSLVTTRTIISQWPYNSAANSAWKLSINTSGKLVFSSCIGTTITNLVGVSQTITTNSWTHVAITRSGSDVKLFINGQQDSTTGNISGSLNNSTDTIKVGVDNTTDVAYFLGYIDTLRISKGLARYTASFTPPTAPFPTDWEDVADPYYDNVVLHLPMDGPENGTSFIDRSKTPNTITVTGNTLLKAALSKFGGRSCYFDGNGDSLTVVGQANTLDTGDFTIEVWIYPTVLSSQKYIIARRHSTLSSNISFGLYIATNNNIIFSWSTNGTIGAGTLLVGVASLNTWQFITICRSSTTIYTSLNGILGESTSTSTSFYASTYNTTVGATNDSGYSFSGYIDSLRITKGTARYTSNFTIPTGPFAIGKPYVADPYASNVKLLLTGSGANGTQVFRDESGLNNIVSSISSTATITRNLGRITGGSLYFPTSQFIKIASSANLNFNASDFTIDFWGYFPVLPTSTNTLPILTKHFSTIVQTEYKLYLDGTTQTIKFDWSTNGTSYISGPSQSFTWNVGWTHIAVVRTTTLVKIYVNGVSDTSGTIGNSALYTGTGDLSIASSIQYASYINNLRITAGTARYTANFTPDYSYLLPPVAITSGDALYDNTVLTLRLDGNYVDSSPKNNTVTAYGNASLSASTYKYGTGSLSLDGVGDYIATPDIADFRFGTGDFCMECWVYPTMTSFADINCIFDHKTGNPSGWYLYLNWQGKVELYNSSSYLTGNTALTKNVWTHIAVTRSSGSVTIWVNGVADCTPSSGGINTDYTGATTYFGIGALINQRDSRYDFKGYIDNVRITKGAARYTTTFTPADIEGASVSGPVRAYSVQSITSNGAVKFTIPVAGVIQAGFSTNASTDITKNDLEYSIQINSSKVLTIVEAGVVKATVGTASDGTNFEIEYSGTTMTYKSNGAQLLTTTVTAGMTLYFSAFIEDTGLSVTAIQIGTYAADGTPGNISGQITSSNVSTYIASAAIGSAYINDLTANKITSGTIQASTSITVGDLTNGVVLGNLGSTYGLRGLKAATEVFRLDANGLDSKIKQTALNLFGSSYHCKIVQEGYYIFNQGTGTTQTTTIPIVIDTFGTYRLIFHITGYYENSDFTQSAACMRYGMQGVYFNNNLLKTKGLGNINWISEEAADSTAVGPFNVDRIDLQFDNVMERYNLILQSRMADPAGSTSKFSYIVWAVDNIAYPYAEY